MSQPSVHPESLGQVPRALPGVREQSVARLILETLVQRGVTAAFGIPGGLVSPLYDALADVPAMRAVTARHEGMAAYAAMGWLVGYLAYLELIASKPALYTVQAMFPAAAVAAALVLERAPPEAAYSRNPRSSLTPSFG